MNNRKTKTHTCAVYTETRDNAVLGPAWVPRCDGRGLSGRGLGGGQIGG